MFRAVGALRERSLVKASSCERRRDVKPEAKYTRGGVCSSFEVEGKVAVAAAAPVVVDSIDSCASAGDVYVQLFNSIRRKRNACLSSLLGVRVERVDEAASFCQRLSLYFSKSRL